MSKVYKIIIGVLLSLIILLGAGSVFLWRGTHELKERAAKNIAETLPAPEIDGSVSGVLVISEIMEDNRATVRDRDGNFSDWIEIYNPGKSTVDLKGWSLSNNIQGSAWVFPSSTIGPGEHLLLFASGKDRSGDELHTSFQLDGDQTLYLREATGRISDISYSSHYGSDISAIRSEAGTMQRCVWPTPGHSNTPEGLERFQQNLNSLGPLVISEVMAFNGGISTQTSSGECGWIELYNTAEWTVNASDYYISFDVNDSRYWHIPEAAVEPGECLVIVCDGSGYDGRYGGNICAPFTLTGDNSQLFLFADSGLIDYVGIGGIPNGCSYGRIPQENGFWFFTEPTPFEPNSDGYRRVSTSPVSLSPDGVFSTSDTATVSLSGRGTIRYTTDGSTPTPDSEEYTAPFIVRSSCIIRASCFEDDAIPSPSITLTYIINEDSALPIVSLVGDDGAAFSRMYSKGLTSAENPGYVSCYFPSGSFSLPCGISMSAVTSLNADCKSMVLRFRDVYGAEAPKLDIFGKARVYPSLILRSGQDSDIGYVRNALCHELAIQAGSNVIARRYLPVTLYVNGSYFGIYFLEEPADPMLYAQSASVESDSVSRVELPVPFAHELYQDVIRYAVFNDPSRDENYRYLAERVDIDSVIDMVILQCSCGNSEFGSGSICLARSDEADGKWHIMLDDMDSTFFSNTGFGILLGDYAWNNVQISSLIVPLMKNDEFRDRFLSRTAELYASVLSPDNIASTVDAVVSPLSGELERHTENMWNGISGFEQSVEQLKQAAGSLSWQEKNIASLCELLRLSDGERAKYFGVG